MLFTLSIIGQIYVTNTLAAKSKELVGLTKHKVQLEKQLSELKLAQSEVGSLTKIEARAVELGFVQNTNAIATIIPPSTTTAVAF